MKAKINEGCIGCGMCASICPKVFKMNEDYLAEVFADVEDADQSNAQEAGAHCPVGVIVIED